MCYVKEPSQKSHLCDSTDNSVQRGQIYREKKKKLVTAHNRDSSEKPTANRYGAHWGSRVLRWLALQSDDLELTMQPRLAIL